MNVMQKITETLMGERQRENTRANIQEIHRKLMDKIFEYSEPRGYTRQQNWDPYPWFLIVACSHQERAIIWRYADKLGLDAVEIRAEFRKYLCELHAKYWEKTHGRPSALALG